jgi:hypothetical protein
VIGALRRDPVAQHSASSAHIENTKTFEGQVRSKTRAPSGCGDETSYVATPRAELLARTVCACAAPASAQRPFVVCQGPASSSACRQCRGNPALAPAAQERRQRHPHCCHGPATRRPLKTTRVRGSVARGWRDAARSQATHRWTRRRPNHRSLSHGARAGNSSCASWRAHRVCGPLAHHFVAWRGLSPGHSHLTGAPQGQSGRSRTAAPRLRAWASAVQEELFLKTLAQTLDSVDTKVSSHLSCHGTVPVGESREGLGAPPRNLRERAPGALSGG